MQKNKIHILSTAALPQSLIEMGIGDDIIIDAVSFIDLKPVIDEELKKKVDELSQKKLTIVFTSINAAEMVINKLHSAKPDWKIYCTEGHTKKMLSKYFGEDSIAGTGINASSVADKILQDKIQEVTFFCGNRRREELPSMLMQHGIKLDEVVVYNTTSIPQLVANNYKGILFFSPNAAESYFSTNTPEKGTILFAIGNTTAASLKKFSDNKIITSESPEKELLIKMAVKYFQAHPVH